MHVQSLCTKPESRFNTRKQPVPHLTVLSPVIKKSKGFRAEDN